jgi:hypothetical protein
MERAEREGLLSTAPVAADRRAFWEKAVTWVLAVLILSDLVLSGLVLISGQAWFDLIHGTDHVDPGGYLKRTGAVWASQLLVQVVAFVRWRAGALHWLLVLAGLRWADVLSDWVNWAAMEDRTWLAHALLLATPLNLLLGLFFYRAYFALRDGRRPTATAS